MFIKYDYHFFQVFNLSFLVEVFNLYKYSISFSKIKWYMVKKSKIK